MPQGRNKRIFKRNATVALRLPATDKRRLREVAASKRRDMSSLILEWINQHLTEHEREQSASAAAI